MSEIGECLREWVSELVSEWVTGKWSHEWMDTFVSTPGLYIAYIKRKRNEKKKRETLSCWFLLCSARSLNNFSTCYTLCCLTPNNWLNFHRSDRELIRIKCRHNIAKGGNNNSFSFPEIGFIKVQQFWPIQKGFNELKMRI